MLRQLALLFGASCPFGHLSAVEPRLSELHVVGDSALLTQAFAQVHQSPSTAPPEAEIPMKHFMDVVSEMRKRWKKHKEQQLKKRSPGEYRALMEHQAKGRADLRKARENKTAVVMPESLIKENSSDVHTQRMGEPMTVIVEDPLGRSFGVRIRSKSRMRILAMAMSHKLHIPLEEVKLTWKETVIGKDDTPTSLGIVEQDEIKVDAPSLQQEKVTKAAEAQKARLFANLQAEAEEQELQVKLERSRKRLANARKVAKEQREQRKEHLMKKAGMITLKFVNVHGRQISMGWKREHWLGPLASLVSKRFGLDESRVTLVIPSGSPIRPHDSIDTLKLRDNDIVQVKYY